MEHHIPSGNFASVLVRLFLGITVVFGVIVVEFPTVEGDPLFVIDAAVGDSAVGGVISFGVLSSFSFVVDASSLGVVDGDEFSDKDAFSAEEVALLSWIVDVYCILF